jgi:predicted esterase
MWSVENPDERQEMQTEGMKENISCINDIIKNEEIIFLHSRIILGGVSQGCATARFTYVLMAGGTRLDGFIGRSSWMAFKEDLRKLDNRALYLTQQWAVA